MSGYVYFIRGSRDNLIKIGYTQNPALRFRAHSYMTAKVLGKMTFVGCVAGTLKDEKFAISHFPQAIPRRREIRSGTISIPDIFPGRTILALDAFKIPAQDPVIGISREIHNALVDVSTRTGVKIKVLVEKALRKAYPVKNGKRNELQSATRISR